MSESITSLVTTENQSVQEFNAFGDIKNFEQAQRMAKALSSSSIVPDNYKGDGHLGDCLIALEIANRVGANVLAVMQNLYIVHGKPAWSSQFLISCVNASRKFTPLRYKMTGVKGGDDYGCIAWATDKSGENLESPEITIGIAKAEGWYSKNGSKWKTMPELMLRYRAATLFARLYAPELTMGIQTDDEVIDVAPIVTDTSRPPKNTATYSAANILASPTVPASPPVEAVHPSPPPPAPDLTPAKELATVVTEAGFDFEKFKAWATGCGWIKTEDAPNLKSFEDVPEDFAKRCLSARAGMLRGLRG